MSLGSKTLNLIRTEHFNDVLSDALRKVHKDQKIIYLDSATGSDTGYNGLRIKSPVATLAKAYELCTAAHGDQILVLPTHNETLTAVQSLAKSYMSIKGLTVGNYRPKFYINGAVDLLSIAAAGIELADLFLSIVTTDAATSLINVASSDAYIHGIKMIPSDTGINVVDVITVTADGDDCVISDIEIWNKTVAVNSFVSLEGAASNVTLKDSFMFGDVATGGIIDAAKVDYLYMRNLRVAVVGTTMPAATLDSNPEGLAQDCYFAGTSTTLADNAALGNLMRLDNIKVTEVTDGSASGNIIPAVDAD